MIYEENFFKTLGSDYRLFINAEVRHLKKVEIF